MASHQSSSKLDHKQKKLNNEMNDDPRINDLSIGINEA